MVKPIDIDPDEFLIQASQLEDALDAFRSYTTDGPQSYLGELSGFNSDFIEKLKGVLRRINDDMGPELLAKIEEHQQTIAELASTFKQADEELASSYEGDK